MTDQKKSKPAKKTSSKPQNTDQGYDEAARSGPSHFGVPEGKGGVFGTTGGGTFEAGMHIEEAPGIYDRSGEPEASDPDWEGGRSGTRGAHSEHFDQTSLEPDSRGDGSKKKKA